MRLLAAALVLIGMALLPGRAMADPAPAFRARATQLVTILAGPGNEADFFSPVFIDAIPVDRWRALAADLRRQHGRPIALGALTQQSATAGQMEVRYERAIVAITLVIAPDPPNRVVGLRIIGSRQADDSMAAVRRDIAALPGRSSFAIARLTDAGPVLLQSHHPDQPLATGSSFKLTVLAELARAVQAGERRWSDVIPLGPKSFSGRLMAWPDHAPMTLHSLATAMIAESDNSASDTLLLGLGRDKVDAMRQRFGITDPRSLPMLTTAEAFALKMPANAELRHRYEAGTIADRRALLRDAATRLTAAHVDVGTVSENPVAIDTLEWFASPQEEIAQLDWLRRTGGEALSIMAVNPGIAPANAKRWRYFGYKGGSEPGVIAMNFLVQAQDGQYYAVSGAWNDPVARVDEGRFVMLMTRALNLLAD